MLAPVLWFCLETIESDFGWLCLIDHSMISTCSFYSPLRGPVGRWRLWSAAVLFRDLMTSKPGLGLLLYDVPPQAFWRQVLKDDDSKEDCDLDAHHPCELTVKSCDIKNDDTYENFASKTSKTRTVTRIARLTPAFIKNDDIYENFASRVLKTRTVTRIATHVRWHF